MSNKTIDTIKHLSKTKGGLRLLLVMIADGVSKDSDVYDAKIETLMADTGYDRRFVQRLISKGIASGELISYPRGNRSSSFQIPMLEGEPGYDPQECPEFARWQNGEEPLHYCSGTHTPLSVNREEQYRVWLGENKALGRRKARRVQRSIDHPKEQEPETTPESGQLTTLEWSIDRPEADNRPPQSGQLTAQYPYSTHSITHNVPTRTREPSSTKKIEKADPEPEADPFPRSVPPLPSLGNGALTSTAFAQLYRARHGIDTKQSIVWTAYLSYRESGELPHELIETPQEATHGTP